MDTARNIPNKKPIGASVSTELDNKHTYEGALDRWSHITQYYYEHLPLLKRKQDNEPRWLFRGDSPRPKPWGQERSKERASLLLPADYDVLDEAFESRLDRVFKEFEITDYSNRHKVEWDLMRAFRRKAHLHSGRRGEDWIERLGLMAHYEAPQRMLDWTYSFFNALYFAVNNSHNKGDCIVWALSKAWLKEQADSLEEEVLKKMESKLGCKKAERMKQYRKCKSHRFDAKIIHFLMLANDMPGIYPITPYYQNERLSIQQGTLICAGTTHHTWGENLKKVLPTDPDKGALVRIPINLKIERRNEVLRELHSMNISQATLFPGLDGFAQSLRMRLTDLDAITSGVPPLDCLEI